MGEETEYYDAIKCRKIRPRMRCRQYARVKPCDVGFTRRYVGCCREPVCEKVLTMPVEEEAEGSTEEEEALTMPVEEEEEGPAEEEEVAESTDKPSEVEAKTLRRKIRDQLKRRAEREKQMRKDTRERMK